MEDAAARRITAAIARVRPGAHVLTPSGRLAVVERVLPTGFLALRYESGVPGTLTLAARLVRLVAAGEVVHGRPVPARR